MRSHTAVTVGYDGDPTGGDGVDSAAPLIKVWDLDKTDKETGHPLCTRISRALPAGRAGVGTVACIVVHEGLQHLALGFMDGTIVLFRGDVTKDRHSKPKVRRNSAFPRVGQIFIFDRERNPACYSYLAYFAQSICLSLSLPFSRNKKQQTQTTKNIKIRQTDKQSKKTDKAK